ITCASCPRTRSVIRPACCSASRRGPKRVVADEPYWRRNASVKTRAIGAVRAFQRMLRGPVWLALALIASGCGLTLRQPAPVKHYYLLEASVQPSTQTPVFAFALKVSNIEIAPPYQEHGLVY